MFDMYQGRASCPNCGALWDCSGQTKFFDPHWPFGARNFSPGTTDELAYSLERPMSRRVWIEWFRVHERRKRRAVSDAPLPFLITQLVAGSLIAAILSAQMIRVQDGKSSKLKGYGAVDPSVAPEIDAAVEELRAILSALIAQLHAAEPHAPRQGEQTDRA